MMSRSWTVGCLFRAFTPTLVPAARLRSPSFYGPLVTTLVLASAGRHSSDAGSLADPLWPPHRHSRHPRIEHPRDLSVHSLSRALGFSRGAILIGVLAASTAPLMLLMAQQLMASRAGLASGAGDGVLGFVTGAIGIPINGAIADAVGLQNSLMSHVILVVVTIVVAWFPSQ